MFVMEKVFLGKIVLLLICIRGSVGLATSHKELPAKIQHIENDLKKKPDMKNTKVPPEEKDCKYADDICPNEDIHFWLYTEFGHHKYNKPIDLSFMNQNIEDVIGTDRFLKVLIHGAYGKKDHIFNESIRTAYYGQGIYNVLIVDYEVLMKDLACIKYGIYNIPIIAKCVLKCLDFILSQNAYLDYVHIIGFSMGTQIAGEIARLMKDREPRKNQLRSINRITALEPPLPCFEEERSFLKATSAKTVDVLHTNSGDLSQFFPVGTIDFYANGGIFQLGCENLQQPCSFCSHERSYLLFAESIMHGQGKNGFIATYKSSKTAYLMSLFKTPGTLVEGIQFGEFLPEDQKGVYFFDTNAKFPFAKNISYVRRITNFVQPVTSRVYGMLPSIEGTIGDQLYQRFWKKSIHWDTTGTQFLR